MMILNYIKEQPYEWVNINSSWENQVQKENIYKENIYTKRFFPWVLSMVLILDGNSEIAAHVHRSDGFFSEKTYFPSRVSNTF